MESSIINVVCAIIEIDHKILVAQRSEYMNLPLKWEFPGGKIKPNETEESSIRREIKEELNIEIRLLKRLNPSFFEYPNMAIQLIPFLAEYLSGDIELKEHKQYKLLNIDELNSLDWAEADIPIVKEVQQL